MTIVNQSHRVIVPRIKLLARCVCFILPVRSFVSSNSFVLVTFDVQTLEAVVYANISIFERLTFKFKNDQALIFSPIANHVSTK